MRDEAGFFLAYTCNYIEWALVLVKRINLLIKAGLEEFFFWYTLCLKCPCLSAGCKPIVCQVGAINVRKVHKLTKYNLW